MTARASMSRPGAPTGKGATARRLFQQRRRRGRSGRRAVGRPPASVCRRPRTSFNTPSCGRPPREVSVRSSIGPGRPSPTCAPLANTGVDPPIGPMHFAAAAELLSRRWRCRCVRSIPAVSSLSRRAHETCPLESEGGERDASAVRSRRPGRLAIVVAGALRSSLVSREVWSAQRWLVLACCRSTFSSCALSPRFAFGVAPRGASDESLA